MKIFNRLSIYIIPICLFLFAVSCTHSHDPNEEGSHSHDTEDHNSDAHHDSEDDPHGHDDEGIHLTREQIETMKIKFGEFSKLKINDFVKTTGTLGLPQNAFYSVNSKANGFIKNSNKYVEGGFAKKGEILAYLENSEFIAYQREYLELAANLEFLIQELDRQQKLMDENAGILKNVQKIQSEVRAKTAAQKSIQKQLEYLGISVDELTPDHIVDRVSIIAPMTGYITSINMHNGMYVTPQQELMEIVSESHLHLELDVFEKDISLIKEEQNISYTVPSLGGKIYRAKVHIIGKEFNIENKTVRIHGHLERERPEFIKDLFVEAKIWLNDESVTALPEKAIIQEGEAAFIFIANDMAESDEVEFEKLMVIPGVSDNGFTSVKLINPIPQGMRIVTDGAFYVYAQSMAGELKHEH